MHFYLHIVFFMLMLTTCNSYRLPGNLKPNLYHLEIKTFLENDFWFEGHVKIRFECLNATSLVVLHSKGLRIAEKDVTVSQLDGNLTIEVTGHHYQLENEFYVISLGQLLQPGLVYMVIIPYTGQLSTNLVGYYRSSYKDKNTGQTKWLAVTKFEPTDARRAFPCFDEPAMKARFHVALVRQSRFSSVSNMPLISSSPLSGDWMRDEYAETVLMSTYLVAFMVSEMASLEATPGRTKFRVWARPDAIAQAKYALDIGPRILAFFEEYFGVEYPLPKMDMVAVPDFGSGAMENWGLCTFRETTMLYDEGSFPASAKETVTRVVAHELAHQWFGNLVTMRWWDEIWLNEGFATFVAALGIHHVQPLWNSREEQMLTAALSVLTMDALQSSRPVNKEIKKSSDIQQMFDPISYFKGAFLVHMMSHFLGEETFRRGLTRYLRAHMYGNAAQDALWSSLEEQARIDVNTMSAMSGARRGTVKQVMDSWTLKPGYPVLRLETDTEQNSIAVSQARFLLDGSGWTGDWLVPLSYTGGGSANFGDTRPRTWLYDRPALLEDPTKGAWLLLNLNATALYRVSYTLEQFRLLVEALLDEGTRDRIPAINRAFFVLDAFDLARAGHLQYGVALDVLRYLRHERHPLPWRAAFASLTFLARMTRHTEGQEPFKVLMRSLLAPMYADLGSNPFSVEGTVRYRGLQERTEGSARTAKLFPLQIFQRLLQRQSEVGAPRSEDLDETVPEIKMRAQLLIWACRMGVGDCEKRAVAIFEAWQKDSDNLNSVPVDVRPVVYCSGVRQGGQPAWDLVWQRYLAADVASEKGHLLDALGCSRDVNTLNRFLHMVLDEGSQIRRQDAYDVFSAVARGSGYHVARQFLAQRIKDLHGHLKHNPRLLGRYFNAIAASMNTEEELMEMRDLARQHAALLQPSSRSVRQALETVALNVRWRGRHHDRLVEWFVALGRPPTSTPATPPQLAPTE